MVDHTIVQLHRTTERHLSYLFQKTKKKRETVMDVCMRYADSMHNAQQACVLLL